ncbi:MAG TPA: Stk1 family PASTA domain-containing Ser/Thr kinase [Solirubrobacteraceae bacterium]|nr:Stk1 family PASTA domain-containing Ser/Thr kinase [Solirubrobacteraceae bacterium]
MPELAEGTIIDGRYRILSRLGSGGMADVYCAADEQLGRKVALKLLYPRFAEDQEFVERFRREASSAAGLQHPHVVSVFDRGEADGTYYIAMEYLEGRSLKALVQQEAPLDPVRAIDIVLQILGAARFAHRRGIIHRDLKPHNVIVDSEDQVKVTDFGIARAGASDVTQTGSIMGTAQYLSPEQAQGHAVSAASDLYSVGIVLYELLTGRVPFDGPNAVTIALKQVSEMPLPPSAYNPAVTPELDAIVLRALEKDPAYRFGDADAFIAALEHARAVMLAPVGSSTAEFAALAADPTALGPPAVGEEYGPVPPPPSDRRRWIWVLVVLALLAALALVAFLLAPSSKRRVPNVAGDRLELARTILHRDGFKTVARRAPSRVGVGRVVYTVPRAGSDASSGSTITLVVSSGAPLVQIPNVANSGQMAASRQLRALGLRVVTHSAPSDTVPQHHVISVTPPAFTQVREGSVVTLTVSSGKRAPTTATVPSVLGNPVASARSTITAAGFRATVVKQDSSQQPGTVIDQSPAANTMAPRGSTVTLTVARQPKVVVPSVVGQTESQAVSTLAAAGFGASTVDQPITTAAQDGTVISQTPAAGQKVKPGSTVTLVIGRFHQTTTGTSGTTGPHP